MESIPVSKTTDTTFRSQIKLADGREIHITKFNDLYRVTENRLENPSTASNGFFDGIFSSSGNEARISEEVMLRFAQTIIEIEKQSKEFHE